jgi:hypothetical protein
MNRTTTPGVTSTYLSVIVATKNIDASTKYAAAIISAISMVFSFIWLPIHVTLVAMAV